LINQGFRDGQSASSTGQGTYSPDLVLVNEYLVSAFRIRCLEIASKVQASPRRVISDGELDFQKLLKEAEARKEIVVHRSKTSDFSVVELKKR
jgi:hypothetical protein